jgi:hypothetical protein
MGLKSSDLPMWYWLLLAHWCQAMPFFGVKLAESLALHYQIWAKTDGIGRHKTISVVFRPLNILHMDMANYKVMWHWLLLAHWCQAIPFFGVKLAESLALHHQIWAKTDGIGRHQTISVVFRSLNILHVDIVNHLLAPAGPLVPKSILQKIHGLSSV